MAVFYYRRCKAIRDRVAAIMAIIGFVPCGGDDTPLFAVDNAELLPRLDGSKLTMNSFRA